MTNKFPKILQDIKEKFDVFTIGAFFYEGP